MIGRAIAARPAYLGLVGSRKRGAAVLGYLAERGLPQADLDRVHVPAGLDLGRTSHEEMAVAILAELVQLRASGALAGPGGAAVESGARPLLDMAHSFPAHGAPAASGEAVDPVCGMAVTADAEHWPLEHGGVTYYFCCAGCRHHYEKELVR
jgi:xanthine dehydrogenase accessory factor